MNVFVINVIFYIYYKTLFNICRKYYIIISRVFYWGSNLKKGCLIKAMATFVICSCVLVGTSISTCAATMENRVLYSWNRDIWPNGETYQDSNKKYIDIRFNNGYSYIETRKYVSTWKHKFLDHTYWLYTREYKTN